VKHLLLTTLALAGLFSPAGEAFTQSAAGVEYTVTVKEPVSHIYNVRMQVSGVRATSIDLSMPAWTPGIYAIRDHARNVQRLEALSPQGQVLEIQKIDKQTWRVTKPADANIDVRYQVFSSNLTDEMGDLTGAALFLYAAGHTGLPAEVGFDLPGGWRVYTGLEGRSNRFRAPNYHALAEAQAFLGQFKVLEFETVGRVPHRIIFSDPRVQFTEAQVVADFEDMTNTAAAIFGKLPYNEYTFLVKTQPLAGATSLGSSHAARIAVGENDFVNQSGYTSFLVAAAQGYARAWIGSRIRPDIRDYSRESYSRLLWFTEGVSAYYADILLMRSRILIPPEFYARASSEIDALQDQPGRLRISLEDASWDTWTRSDNAADISVSYWLKGKLTGLLLDAEIRGRSNGSKSLDDVVKHLMAEYPERGRALGETDLAAAIERATGIAVEDFLDHAVRSRAELNYNKYLEPVGLQASVSRIPPTIQFGIEFERLETSQVRVRRVLPDSAAADAKVDAGDVLVAVDSERVTFDNLTARIHSRRIGRPVALTVLRGNRLLTLSLVPRAVQSEQWALQEVANATPEQVRLKQGWLSR
jgi:predicted metalloprotease with PDZ domain